METRAQPAVDGLLERELAYGVVRHPFEAPLAAGTPDGRERWLPGAAGLAAAAVVWASMSREELKGALAATSDPRSWSST